MALCATSHKTYIHTHTSTHTDTHTQIHKYINRHTEIHTAHTHTHTVGAISTVQWPPHDTGGNPTDEFTLMFNRRDKSSINNRNVPNGIKKQHDCYRGLKDKNVTKDTVGK